MYRESAHLNKVIEKLTGTRFCRSCQKPRALEGGKFITPTKRTTNPFWRCKECVDRVMQQKNANKK